MEVNGLGLLNMDDYRMSPASYSSASFAAETSPASNPKNFEEILRKAASSKEGTSKEGTSEKSDSAPSNIKSNKVDKEDRLYQLCLELETFLVKNLLTSMRNTVQKSGLVDEGFAGKIYEDMLYDEYAKDFTKNAGFGLAEQAYLQLKNQ